MLLSDSERVGQKAKCSCGVSSLSLCLYVCVCVAHQTQPCAPLPLCEVMNINEHILPLQIAEVGGPPPSVMVMGALGR